MNDNQDKSDSEQVSDNIHTKDASTGEQKDVNSSNKAVEDEVVVADPAVTPKQNFFKRFGRWYLRKKWLSIPLSIILLIAVLLGIPTTRYLLVGSFWQEPAIVTVIDSQNNKPVSEATVMLDGKTIQTNTNGQAKFSGIHVGSRQVTINKKYYKEAVSTITVPLFAHGKTYSQKLTATGRLVTVNVRDLISDKPLVDVVVDANDGNKARTDTEGKAVLVFPADKQELPGTVQLEGYNDQKVILKQETENNLKLVAKGKIYFLSKQSGKLDIVKTNLDGTQRQTVLAGTGLEEDNATSLLASRDWKYIALKAKREVGKPAAMYLINTADDTISPMDQGEVEFTPIGWSGSQFIYRLDRTKVEYWQAKKTAIKSFNASTKQITLLDENQSEGDTQYNARYETLNNSYILDNTIVYVKSWNRSYGPYAISLADKQASIITISPNGTNKKTLKSYSVEDINYIEAKLYLPQEVYFVLHNANSEVSNTYVELEDGVIKNVQNGAEAFVKEYPTFLLSPNGNESFWRESRDGKNVLFVGGKNAQDANQLALLADYTPYGWYGDNYLLLQKNDSELYITTKDRLKMQKDLLKISDYHKPALNFAGYGYGYGGQ